nr:hypothetical protein BACY1_25850 [Tenacibaculum mesophilum]
MKKVIIMLLSVGVLVAFQKVEDKKVYICSSVASTKYHFKKIVEDYLNVKQR